MVQKNIPVPPPVTSATLPVRSKRFWVERDAIDAMEILNQSWDRSRSSAPNYNAPGRNQYAAPIVSPAARLTAVGHRIRLSHNYEKSSFDLATTVTRNSQEPGN